MLRALALACCLSGCHIVFDLDAVSVRTDGGGAGDDDLAGDADDSGLPCYGGTTETGGFISVCLQPDSDDAWVDIGDIDTDSAVCEQTQPHAGGPDLCIIAATTIAITSATLVHGDRPLVLVATETLQLAATLKVNSTRVGGYRTGPGANAMSCMPGHGVTGGIAGGGGAGGTFGGNGGGGGAGDGAAGGPVTTVPVVRELRGGCPGGDGGNFGMGSGGAGGGAVYLIAGTQLVINTGTIDASGMAGRGGAEAGDGAGGGGSGGMIVLDAPMITLTGATLIAHGAGGGGGSSDASGGSNGGEVNFSNTQYPSVGGAGDLGNGGNGGNGGGGSTVSTPGGTMGFPGTGGGSGGGGGGGGHGVIYVFGIETVTSSVISPALQM